MWQDGLYPPFTTKVQSLIDHAVSAQLPDVGVNMGLRTFAQQDGLYALGRTVPNPDGKSAAKPMGNIVTKAKGGQSWHNYGVAVDIVFRLGGQWSWSPSLPWEKLGQLGEDLGLVWGGRWKFQDLPHFEMTGKLGLADIQNLYARGGLPSIWDAIGANLA